MNLRPWKFCFAYQLSFSINVKNFNLSNMPPEKKSSTNSWQPRWVNGYWLPCMVFAIWDVLWSDYGLGFAVENIEF
ncbi:Uncharacterized protein TCM_041411 [Theobroma cacao]|uniref:Uncharacterized protein n=1 Tax=Theobroma cacao TaxID=3641 RepID=A0A061GVI9_THECC|nr:Uncharacterized protein TCM_041411 [Theobroma cacao]